MRTGRMNKQKMYYALKGESIPIYERNSDGTIKYITVDGVSVPVETGAYEVGYSVPEIFYGNISTGGEVEAQEFGLSISDYDALIVIEKDAIPVTETSLIWHTSEPEYKDLEEEIVNPNSADYKIVAVKESLNATKYALKRITK